MAKAKSTSKTQTKTANETPVVKEAVKTEPEVVKETVKEEVVVEAPAPKAEPVKDTPKPKKIESAPAPVLKTEEVKKMRVYIPEGTVIYSAPRNTADAVAGKILVAGSYKVLNTYKNISGTYYEYQKGKFVREGDGVKAYEE